MKLRIKFNLFLPIVGMLSVACSQIDEPESVMSYPGIHPIEEESRDWRDSVYYDSPIRHRHREAPLKILAIGNSFTHNATTYMPWLIDCLDADSICIAKLTHSGRSLQQHWNAHVDGTPDYEMYYSDGGKWMKEDIATIDQALTVMDWDIITIQQASGLSGVFISYYPYLGNLIDLFHKTSSEAKIAWHSTWAYRDGCEQDYFSLYDYSPEKMYLSILDAAEKAGEMTDITIPSTDLIWRMRQEYPEVTDGFSADGFHITDSNALHALSLLWYEVLVTPYSGNSGLDLKVFPSGLTAISCSGRSR